MGDKRKLFVISNSLFSIMNFRRELVEYLCDYRDVLCFSAKDPNYLDDMSNVNCEFKFIPFDGRKIQLVTLIWCTAKVMFLIYKYKPREILSFTIKPNILLLLMKPFINSRLIINITGFGSTCDFRKSSRFNRVIFALYIKLLSNADVIFVQNSRDERFVKSKLKSRGPKLIKLKGSGVDSELFTPISRGKINKFIYVGRIMESKGVSDFLSVANRVNYKNQNKSFHVYGSGDRSLINEIEANKNIEYCGFVREMPEVYANSDVLIFCSRYSEGTPRVLLEAFASGVLVVCRTSFFTNDLKKLGLIFDTYSNLDQLEDKINSLLQIPRKQVQEYADHNRKIALGALTTKEVCSSYWGAVNEI